MSESTDPPTRAVPPTPGEMPWVISYLRDDIQDLRVQIRAGHDRIDETNKRMDTYFLWIMGTLVAITGVLIAVIKL